MKEAGVGSEHCHRGGEGRGGDDGETEQRERIHDCDQGVPRGPWLQADGRPGIHVTYTASLCAAGWHIGGALVRFGGHACYS